MKVLCNVSIDLLNVYTSLAWMFCFPNRGPKGTLPFVFSYITRRYARE